MVCCSFGGRTLSAAEQHHETGSSAETEAVAAAIAQQLAPGDIVLLSGEMGSGKSTFVRGAAISLGYHGPVTSPTYVLVHRYDGERTPIAHLDLHRLSELGTEDHGLIDDHLTDGVIAFIEWPDAVVQELPRRARAEVALSHLGGDKRAITVTLHD